MREKTFLRTSLTALLAAACLAGCGGADAHKLPAADTAMTEEAVDAAAADAGYGLYDNVAYVTETPTAGVESYEEESGAVADSGGQLSEENAQVSERKLIRTVDLYTETERYDELLVDLEGQIAALGGYVEYRYQYNGNQYEDRDFLRRNCNLTVRIPSDRLDEFIGKVNEASNIVNKEERVEDVTLRYVDLESHRNALATEQERLMELLEQAETVEDLITIESRLSEVRYELESMESQLRTLMNQVSYSTVNLNVQEVKRLTPTEESSVPGRIRQGFSESLYNLGMDFQNGFVGFVIHLPYIVCWLVGIAVAFLVLRFVWKLFRRRCPKKAWKGFGRRHAKSGSGQPESAPDADTEDKTEDR